MKINKNKTYYEITDYNVYISEEKLRREDLRKGDCGKIIDSYDGKDLGVVGLKADTLNDLTELIWEVDDIVKYSHSIYMDGLRFDMFNLVNSNYNPVISEDVLEWSRGKAKLYNTHAIVYYKIHNESKEE